MKGTLSNLRQDKRRELGLCKEAGRTLVGLPQATGVAGGAE